MSVHKSVASVAGLLQLRSSYAWTVTSKLGGTVLGGVDSKVKVVLAQGAVEQKETQLWALVAELKEAQVRDTPTTPNYTAAH